MLAYLATPYTKYGPGLPRACKDAANVAGRLLQKGVMSYSPIVHGHMLATCTGMSTDYHVWIPHNEEMMRRCDALIVVHLPGWDRSVGIADEIMFFENLARPIFDLPDIETLELRRRGQRHDRGGLCAKW